MGSMPKTLCGVGGVGIDTVSVVRVQTSCKKKKNLVGVGQVWA